MFGTVFVNLLFFGGVFETLSEMDFVVRVLVFSYLLFWLYMTFMPAKAESLFGLSAIAAGYLIFAHGVSITILVLFFLFFVVLGNQLQMLVMFGILPLFGRQWLGDRFVTHEEAAGGGGAQNATELAGQYYTGEEQAQYASMARRRMM